DKLRQFVQVGFPKESAYAGNARIVLGCLLFRVGVNNHGSELVAFEQFVLPPKPQLFEDDRTLGVEANCKSNDRNDDREDGKDYEQGEYDIKRALQYRVDGNTQRLPARSEHGKGIIQQHVVVFGHNVAEVRRNAEVDAIVVRELRYLFNQCLLRERQG